MKQKQNLESNEEDHTNKFMGIPKSYMTSSHRLKSGVSEKTRKMEEKEKRKKLSENLNKRFKIDKLICPHCEHDDSENCNRALIGKEVRQICSNCGNRFDILIKKLEVSN